MARKKSAEDLRTLAAQMIKQAKQLEDLENAKIGALVRDIAINGYKISYNELQKNVSNMLSKTTSPTINQQANTLKTNDIKQGEQKLSNGDK